MARGQQLVRQWKILRAIETSRRGLTATELHERVSDLGGQRTVYRDLDVLQEVGFTLYQEDDGRWRLLEPSEGGTTIPIQPTEMLGLLLSEQVMDSLRGSELGEAIGRLRSKLMAMLGPRGQEFIDRHGRGFVASLSAPGMYGHRRDDLQVIERAVADSRRLRIVHFAAHRHQTIEREVDPYGLWFVDGALYLVAWDHLRDAYRKFLVDRIRRIQEVGTTFEPDPGFDLQDYVGRGFRVWHGAVHHVVVEFAAEIAHMAGERRFHRTQRVRPLDGGRVRVTFDAAGLPDLAAWVCSFGGTVRALEPPELVTMVREMAERTVISHEERAPRAT